MLAILSEFESHSLTEAYQADYISFKGLGTETRVLRR